MDQQVGTSHEAESIHLDGEGKPTVVQPFSRAMIHRYLDRISLTYVRDEQGDFRVDFQYDASINCAPTFWLMAVGSRDEIYGIEARSTRRFPPDMWEWCLYTSNEWNKRMRYPKAYFFLSDETGGPAGEFRLEQYTDLEAGAFQDLIDNLTESLMGSSMRFWSWLNEQTMQYALATADNHLDG